MVSLFLYLIECKHLKIKLYSGECNYEDKYLQMTRMLLTRFGKEIEVDGVEINNPPGCYEIQVIEGGLAWSKV